MKALDTNVLVRFLVNDNPTQAAKVRSIFQNAERRDERFLVSSVVVFELLWVLEKVYAYSREDVLRALVALWEMEILEFEDAKLVNQLVTHGARTKMDLPDLFIGLSTVALEGDSTLTFDRVAAKSELFELL